eukprot:Selendium_serpulae@DN8665_c0_g1_i1.p2
MVAIDLREVRVIERHPPQMLAVVVLLAPTLLAQRNWPKWRPLGRPDFVAEVVFQHTPYAARQLGVDQLTVPSGDAGGKVPPSLVSLDCTGSGRWLGRTR